MSADNTNVAEKLRECLMKYRFGWGDDVVENVGKIEDACKAMNADITVEQKSASCFLMRFGVGKEQQASIERMFPIRCMVAVDTEYMAKTDEDGEIEMCLKKGERVPKSGTSGAMMMIVIDLIEISFGAHTAGSNMVPVCFRVDRHLLIPANTQMTPEELKNYFLKQETVRELCQGSEPQMATVYGIYPNAKKKPRPYFSQG